MSFYDELAPWYREYAARRRAYLDAIDALVIAGLRGATLLDVGSGDGRRVLSIARRAHLSRVVMCEPSAEMRQLCADTLRTWQQESAPDVRVSARVLDIPAEALDALDERFDNITCLWNVLGHVPSRADRISALGHMSRLLAPGGTMQLDVHNRYNARAYGWWTVAGNVVRDRRHPQQADGERPVRIDVEGRSIAGRGYVFSPGEMEVLFAAAGLRVLERVVVEYDSGRIRRWPTAGQLFYRLASVR